MEQELYEEDVKVVILPDRQEVTSEDLATMPDVVRERVRFCLSSGETCFIIHSHCHIKQSFVSSYIMQSYSIYFTLECLATCMYGYRRTQR